MRRRDILMLASQNLWARKTRTLLNLFGVTVSCCLLLMTFAGTRGAAEGMLNLLSDSSQARQIFLFSWVKRDTDVPREITEISEPMDAARKQRLQDILREQWIRQNAERVYMTPEVLRQLRNLDHLESIVPQGNLRCDVFAGDEKVSGTTVGIDTNNPNYAQRLIAGQLPSADDPDGILLDEFTAYRLGYRTDKEIKNLVGTTVNANYQIGKGKTPELSRLARLFRALGGDGLGVELPELVDAVQQLTSQLDQTNLTPRQKELILKTIGTVSPNETTSQPDGESNEQLKTLPGKTAQLSVRADGQKMLSIDFVVRGIIQQPGEDESLPFLRFIPSSSKASLYLPARQLEQIHSQRDSFVGFSSALASIDKATNLAKVIDNLEITGFRTRSALAIVEKIDKEIGQAKLAATALALLILLVAAIGISNTMIIAVLERTPEFGIMKSLGTRDRQVLWLVLLEGLMTGVLGAGLAVVLSVFGARWVTGVARTYIEGRLRTNFNQPVFVFAWHDFAIVFFVAIVVCTIASLVPAWRAARLDPVVAMRRK